MSQGLVQVPVVGVVSGLEMAQDINTGLAALASLYAGASAPTTGGTGLSALSNMLWADTTSGSIVKQRNAGDSAWRSRWENNDADGFKIPTGTLYVSSGAVAITDAVLENVLVIFPTNAAFASNAISVNTTRAANSAFDFLAMQANSVVQFRVNGVGHIYTQGSGVLGNGTDFPTLSGSNIALVAMGTATVQSRSIEFRDADDNVVSRLSFGVSDNAAGTGDDIWIKNNTGKRIYVENVSAGLYLAQAGTSWTAVSDEDAKDILGPIEAASDKLSTLRTVFGKYKNDGDGIRRPFLIAQDVVKVFPEAVDASNARELGLRYTDIIPFLTAALNEHTARLNRLEAR